MSAEVQAVARAEIEAALLDLGLFPDGRETGVHEARKHFKKLRALARLVRRDLDDFRGENRRLRDIARELSATRDAAVLHEAFDATFQDLAEPAVAATRRMLPAATGESEAAHDRRTARLLPRLREAHAALSGWRIRETTLAHGATRTYRQGRRALRAAETDATDDRFHTWRKRVKDHWYQMRLLCERSAAARGRRADLKRLSGLLGDANDLCLLRAALPDADPTVLRRIAGRSRELRSRALALGRTLYGESPAAFSKRVRAP